MKEADIQVRRRKKLMAFKTHDRCKTVGAVLEVGEAYFSSALQST